MSLDRKPVMVRLSKEAYDALTLVARVKQQDLGEAMREIAEEVLLGRAHVVRMTAERFARALTKVKTGEGE